MAQINAAKKPETATAKPAPKKGGKKSQWRRWGERIQQANDLVLKLYSLAGKVGGVAGKNLAEASGAETQAGLAAIVGTLQVLDADQVAVPTLPPLPKFSVGDVVRIKKAEVKRFVGLFTADELAKMKIVRVSEDGRQFLCSVHGIGTLPVRYASQLEKVE